MDEVMMCSVKGVARISLKASPPAAVFSKKVKKICYLPCTKQHTDKDND